jgi:hypothetical protein
MTRELPRSPRKVPYERAELHPDRVTRLEQAVEAIQHTLDVQLKRISMLQAELDAIRAKLDR